MSKVRPTRHPYISMQWIDPPAWAIKPYPKGTTFKKNSDGTITPILPTKAPSARKERTHE